MCFTNHFVLVGTSTLGTIFLIVNAALGAGLLNFPKAFDQAGGVEVALIVQAFLIVFVIFSLLILAKCSDVNGAGTVQVSSKKKRFCFLAMFNDFKNFRLLYMEQVVKLVNMLALSVLPCTLLVHA